MLKICLCAFATGATASQNPGNQILKAVADLNLPYIENKGQVADPRVAYVAETFACRVAVTRNGQMIFSLPDNKERESKIAITEHQTLFDALRWMIDQYLNTGDTNTVKQLMMSDSMLSAASPRVKESRRLTLKKLKDQGP